MWPFSASKTLKQLEREAEERIEERVSYKAKRITERMARLVAERMELESSYCPHEGNLCIGNACVHFYSGAFKIGEYSSYFDRYFEYYSKPRCKLWRQ